MADILFTLLEITFFLCIAIIAFLQRNQFVEQVVKVFLLVPIGCTLIIIGKVLSLSDQFPIFEQHLLLGPTIVNDYLERFVFNIIGFVLIFWGTLGLIPYFKQFSNMQSELQQNQSNYRYLYEQQLSDYQEQQNKITQLQTKEKQQRRRLDRAHWHQLQAQPLLSIANLVGSITHELNTPIGVAVTASSFLNESSKELETTLSHGQLKKSDLEGFLGNSLESSDIILHNLQRSAELINQFKQLANEQQADACKEITLEPQLQQLLSCLHQPIQRAQAKISIQSQPGLTLTTHVASFNLLFYFLITNSLNKGLVNHDHGQINIKIKSIDNKGVVIDYHDTGSGLPNHKLEGLFQKNQQEQTQKAVSKIGGLAHLYYLISHQLEGNVRVYHAQPNGLGFFIELNHCQTLSISSKNRSIEP